MKNSNDTIGNRTRDLPNCSAVPQPTALPRAPGNLCAEGFEQGTFCIQTRFPSSVTRFSVAKWNKCIYSCLEKVLNQTRQIWGAAGSPML